MKNYLYTIAGNTVKNYYKKKRDIPWEELTGYENDNKGNEKEIGIRMDIERAVKNLPEEIREVAILFFSGVKAKRNCGIAPYQAFSCKISNRTAKELLIKDLEVEKNEKI